MQHRKFELETEKKACFIFGAGGFYGLWNRPKKGDFVIAADGGLGTLEKLGIRPSLLIGDLDSLSDGERETRAADAFLRLSVIKDTSDSAAAIEAGKEQGCTVFYLYGCTGGRLDHTLASLQDLAALSRTGTEAYLFSEREVFTALTDGRLDFPEGMKGTVSVFSHSDECLGVEESGLKYTVAEHRLTNLFPLGLSNAFTALPASIAVKSGTLFISIELKRTEAFA